MRSEILGHRNDGVDAGKRERPFKSPQQSSSVSDSVQVTSAEYERTKSQCWSPTRDQVDEYILLLEKKMSRDDFRARLLRIKERGTAGDEGFSLWRNLFWRLVAMLLRCFEWVAQTIFGL
jgi:hypothetical protein